MFEISTSNEFSTSIENPAVGLGPDNFLSVHTSGHRKNLDKTGRLVGSFFYRVKSVRVVGATQEHVWNVLPIIMEYFLYNTCGI